MQTLYIPEKIVIEFKDENGNPNHQNNILVGIQIFANYKNDIHLSPFLSDQNGIINISKNDIEKSLSNFISYGLMDYSSLESAKPEIQIQYLGNSSINKYLEYRTKILSGKTDLKQFEIWGEKLGKRDQEFAQIEKREREEFEIYSSCNNRKFNEIEDVILIQDNWGSQKSELIYKVEFRIK